MRFTWTIGLLVMPAISHALAQVAGGYVSSGADCAQLNETVVAQVAKGQLALAESMLSKAAASGLDRAGDRCAGFVLNNMAALLSIQGRIAEAEGYAERSLRILEAKYPPTDLTLLRPLSVLASTRFEQGKIAGAREAFRKMESIRAESPADRALVHEIGAVLLHAQGRKAEAESEYLLTFKAWEEAGCGDTANAGSVFNSLGALYVNEQRLEDARRAVDRALTIFSRAKDAVPMDRIKALHVMGVVQARQGAWQESEQTLSEALSMADREVWVEPVVLRSILVAYAYVLRKNHHGREARSIKARAAGIHGDAARSAIVDVTELLAEPEPAKK